MTRFKAAQPAPEGTIYASDAFGDQVGKTIPFNTPTGSYEGQVVAVEVADDGRSVEYTMDVPDEAVEPLLPDVEHGSFELVEFD